MGNNLTTMQQRPKVNAVDNNVYTPCPIEAILKVRRAKSAHIPEKDKDIPPPVPPRSDRRSRPSLRTTSTPADIINQVRW